MHKTSLALIATLAVATLAGCTAEPPQERDEATFVELVRAAGGVSAENDTDAELIATGDEMCADAQAGGGTITETAELALSMAQANPSSAAYFVALVAETSRLLCPELE